jgi:predicted NBD/HSP70 family sugar kinase
VKPSVALGVRSETVRRSNLATLLRQIHLNGAATRSELVTATGLTRSAVGTLVGELVEMGFVREERSVPDGSPGRPSPIVRPDTRDVVLAMEVLVDFVAVAAVALGGEVLATERIDRPREATPIDRTVADLAALTRRVLDDLPAGARVHRAEVAIAGVIRRSDGMVVVAPNIGWRDEPLAEQLRAALPLDVPVAVGNDGDLGVLAVSRRGVAVGADDVVYLSAEVGVGSGVISDGTPLLGTEGFAGEVGHLPVNRDGRPCKCGSVGCWETEVGEEALLRRTGRPVNGGRAALDEVLEAAEDGDADVLAALREHGRWLGYGLGGVINAFDPEVVVLGGMFARIHPYVADELDRRAFDVIREHVRVVPAADGVDPPLLGAAERAWDQVIDDPAHAAATRVAVTGHT